MGGFTTVDKAVNSAKELGHLDPATIWALICMGLVVYIVYMLKQNQKSDKQWQDVRVTEARADADAAAAMNRLADKIGQLQLILLTQKLGGLDAKGLDPKAP